MSAQSFYFLLVILLSRYSSLLKIESNIIRSLVPLIFTAVMIAPVVSGDNILGYAILFLVTVADDSILVRGRNNSPLKRVISTMFVCVAVLVTLNLNVFDSRPSQVVINALISIQHLVNFGVSAQTITNFFIVSVGFLLTAFEGNYLVLALLRSYSGGIGGQDDEGTTLKMGKLIGVLERTILYVLIMTGNITTIGFIIAAKALARFKELEDRKFAEYFLVGTLASVGITLVVSLWIKAIMV